MTTTQTKETILEIKNLSISFKRGKEWKEVVKSINFSLKKGDVLGLVGESGSGKSVSSLAIMGLLDRKIAKISNGEIIFHTQDSNEESLHLENFTEKDFQKLRGKHIAMIFQEPMTALNPVKKCGAQVDEMILTHYNISKQKAKKKTLSLFQEVLLPDIERAYNSYPFELSGGQRQRIMIAMAISCEPEILIADEPTTALDVTVQKTILNLILSLQKKRNMSVLFISHDLGVVHKMCNQAAVIYKGEILEQNSIEDIFNNPQQPYTKGLIASRPPLDYKPERLLTINDFLNGKDVKVRHISQEETDKEREKIYSQEPILSVEGLNIEYILQKNIFGKATKKFHAIKDISFQVYKGETLGLVGESGCGKTTVGRAIMQLIESKSGKISFKGKNLKQMSAKQRHELRKKIQIVFQDPYSSLNPRKTIGSMIEEPMEVFHILDSERRKAKTIELLCQVGLGEEYYSRYPHELSGGQRQRIGIARALTLEPELIICDESVSALDVSVQAQVLNLLNDLKKNYGFTYIFISHDLSVVKYMSDRIVVMKSGEIMESNYAEEIYSHPQTPYTQTLISSIQN